MNRTSRSKALNKALGAVFVPTIIATSIVLADLAGTDEKKSISVNFPGTANGYRERTGISVPPCYVYNRV